LKSARWAEELFVVDSLSTEGTQEVARRVAARVYAHPFEGHTKQRNPALDNLPFLHGSALVSEGDEGIFAAPYFSPFRPEELADRVYRVATDDTLRGGLGTVGREPAAMRFRWGEHVRRILEIAEGCLR